MRFLSWKMPLLGALPLVSLGLLVPNAARAQYYVPQQQPQVVYQQQPQVVYQQQPQAVYQQQPPVQYVNDGVGRRFNPNNMGNQFGGDVAPWQQARQQQGQWQQMQRQQAQQQQMQQLFNTIGGVIENANRRPPPLINNMGGGNVGVGSISGGGGSLTATPNVSSGASTPPSIVSEPTQSRTSSGLNLTSPGNSGAQSRTSSGFNLTGGK